MKFFIIHGALGSSKENWIPWLNSELFKLKNDVISPDLPTPQGQTVDIWMHLIDKDLKKIDSNTGFVGHSVGCAFILSVLERLKFRVSSCFLVAGFFGPLGIELDKINNNIACRAFNWVKIKSNCKKFFVFASDNDPFVPIAKSKELADKLGAEFIVVNNAGHFNSESGYTEFKLLLEKIISSVSE